MQRIANPSTPVRFRPQPPITRVTKAINIEYNNVYARVVELVDTRDLKSLEGNFVPVRVRPRAPDIHESKKIFIIDFKAK